MQSKVKERANWREQIMSGVGEEREQPRTGVSLKFKIKADVKDGCHLSKGPRSGGTPGFSPFVHLGACLFNAQSALIGQRSKA